MNLAVRIRVLNTKAPSSPFMNRLTKVVLIVVTAFCGSGNVTPPDRTLDEAAQLNSSDSSVNAKSSARRSVSVVETRDMATTHREGGKPIDQLWTVSSLGAESVEFPRDHSESAMPRTSYGVGSFALSALGGGVPVPLQRT
jgi:hypothetical protein